MEFHEAANIFPLLTGTEYTALREDIRANGLIEPVILYEGKIRDGRNRYTACLDIGIEPAFDEWKNGHSTPLSYVISKNLHRRHLNETQRAVVASKIANIQLGGNQYISGSANLQILPVSQSKAAEMLNVSERTVASVKAIERDAPDLLPKMESEKMAVSKAIQEMRKREVVSDLESIETRQVKEIEGVYDTIVIDPPWPMVKIERDERPNQTEFDYPTMTLPDIYALRIPAARNCHVWLWTTHKYLPVAFDLLQLWGCNYICTFVWHKPGGFQPFGLPQYNCEFALYAHKGAPKFIDLKNLKVCFDAPRGAHSEKPDEFYSIVRRVTGGRRLDMFSRREIEGFDAWGKEAINASMAI